MEEPKVGCLIMAAGNAKRFRANKLAAEFEGKPLIQHALEAVPKALFSKVVVVTQYPEIEKMAEEYGYQSIHNRHPEYGISYTIRLGTEALLRCNAIMYMVSDQPLLDDASVERIVRCWRDHPCNIIGAAHNGKRGNPCLFPREFFDELMALEEDHGGNQVIRAHADRLITVEVAKEELTDVDTPEALRELEQQKNETMGG